MSDLSKSVIFPIGEKLNSNHFNGTVWLDMLVPMDAALPAANVTFEPGCRNNWHFHVLGADIDLSMTEGTIRCFRAFQDCLKGAVEAEIVYGMNACKMVDVKGLLCMDQTIKLGRNA